ncbi:MAG: hypothetical protein GX285_09250 [Clostridiales bacterium]|nr:hypothetical protein [Clostridiales bacterium]
MKTIQIVKYQIQQAKIALMIYYAIIFVIAIMLVSTMSRAGLKASENVYLGGLDFASMIFILVLGLTSFKESYYFMQANNITRKGFYKGHLLSIFSIAAFMSFLDIIINLILNTFSEYNTVFSQIYLRNNSMTVSTAFMNFIWSFSLLTLIAMIGYFIAIVYYRSNTVMKIVVSVAPFVLINVLGYLNSITDGAIGNAVNYFNTWMWGLQNGYHPYFASINIFAAFIIFGVFSYLLIRKAPIK